MNPETDFDLSNVDSELLEKATTELTTSEGDATSGYPPSCEKGGMWEF